MKEPGLKNEELEQVAGGGSVQDTMYNLNYYEYRTVSVPVGTLLVMQERPGGTLCPHTLRTASQSV